MRMRVLLSLVFVTLLTALIATAQPRTSSGIQTGTLLISESEITYWWNTPHEVAGSDKVFGDLFNASGSGKVIRIIGIYPINKSDSTVTGSVAIRFDTYRTSTVGTGGIPALYKSAFRDADGGSISPGDTDYANLPAQVTARWLPSGGATISEWVSRAACFVEETNAASHLCSGQTNMISSPIVLREGEGLLLMQGPIASTGSIAFRIVFIVD